MQVTGTSWPRPVYTLLVTGLCRFKLVSVIQEHPYLVATVNQLDDIKNISGEGERMMMYTLFSLFFFKLKLNDIKNIGREGEIILSKKYIVMECCVIAYSFHSFFVTDDAQVAELVAEFKEASKKLIDMLDISLPGVAKLKVRLQ